MGITEPDAGRDSESRHEPRLELRLLARIESLSVCRSVALLNLSPEGAMIECDELPPLGADVVLACGEIDVLGVIKWARRHRAGIRFDEPVSEALVLRYRNASRQLAGMEQTPATLRAARKWATGR